MALNKTNEDENEEDKTKTQRTEYLDRVCGQECRGKTIGLKILYETILKETLL